MGNKHPLPIKGTSPQFSAHVYSNQTAARIKMTLGMEVGLRADNIVLDEDRVPSSQKRGRAPPQFLAHVYCGQTAEWMRWHWAWRWALVQATLCKMATQLPLQKSGAEAPRNFGTSLVWPNGLMHQNALGMEVGLSPRNFVLDGDQPPSPKRGFSANVYCGQTAGWIKMPLGADVGLGPTDIVLHGDPAPPSQKRAQPPIFRPCLLWANSCMYQDITWYGRRPQPR